LRQTGRRPDLAEIDGHDDGIGAIGPEFLGQGSHRLNAPRDKNQIVAIPSQFARETGTDAAGRTGNERKRATANFGRKVYSAACKRSPWGV
jgi:hypothetical protein